MTNQAYDFLVRRDDLHRTEFRPLPAATDVPLTDGQVLLSVDAFAFTANNVTYAVFGDSPLMYWNFFPAPEGWGRIPVWGFAEVTCSAHPAIEPGERIYGYLPMSSHFVVDAGRVSAGSFDDLAPHRQPMSPFYNQYLRVAADPGYDRSREAEQMLFRPLFATAFLIDDFLAEQHFFGARSVVVSSASSKTSIALAFQLFGRGRNGCEVVGLTSSRHRDFVAALGIHHRVVVYDEIEALDASVPTVFVDMAGDAGVTTTVHRHFGPSLAYSCQVGGTHWHDLAFGVDVPGPTPTLFFAPDRLMKRLGDWGPAGLQSRLAAAWLRFLPCADGSVTINRSTGPEALEAVYRVTLDGKADPSRGYVVSL
jgi:hypothetical protein